MLRQRQEAVFAASLTEVFTALVVVSSRGRWSTEDWLRGSGAPPRVGWTYVHRQGAGLRTGRVVECSRPVSLTLYETWSDPPCRASVQLRWRLDPVDSGTRVVLEARYSLNGPAHLNRRQWGRQLHGHCSRLLAALSGSLEKQGASGDAQGETGVSGQNNGSSSITVTNTTSVKGRPSLR